LLILVLATPLLSACQTPPQAAAGCDKCPPEPRFSSIEEVRERLKSWRETRLRFIKAEFFAPKIAATLQTDDRFLCQPPVRDAVPADQPPPELPPDLKSNVIVRLLLRGHHIRELSLQRLATAVATAQKPPALRDTQLASLGAPQETQQVADAAQPSLAEDCDCHVTEHHFKAFGEFFAHHVLRRTKGEVDAKDAGNKAFWSGLKRYYEAYYNGDFVTHFGTPLEPPRIGLTISDADLTNALLVFIEYLFDFSFKTPVWSESFANGSKRYYPGGAWFQPTSLTVFPDHERPFIASALESQAGCGITPAKAMAIRFLAAEFSAAASTEAGLIIGSIGGIDTGITAGVGLLGKLSIGDNKLFLSITQAAVSEIAARWTVEATYPILARLEFKTGSAGSVSTFDFTAPFQAPAAPLGD
jgi:hypothetical protein